jgi:hypothetical protein
MSTYQPQSASSSSFLPATSGPDFRSVASKQRGLMICILGYIVISLIYFVARPDLRSFLSSIALCVVLAGTVYVFVLATALYNTGTGILLGILSLMPILGLIVLLILQSKANRLLKANGIRIGLMGADMDQVRSA